MNTISTVQLKRGLKTVLEAKLIDDNKPLNGEPIFEIDTNKLKIGNGIDNYIDLPYISGADPLEQIIFDTYLNFPKIGEENKLYVAKDKFNSYIWTGSSYKPIAVDGKEIDGGSANTIY